ncbi:carbonic anhydrase-like [Alosa sapidissima]|uniref:carbonic anhydrase-like n=1 Tax=Alosa sapidissima TaxID=34773 RepID=UPI001C08103A|nr:carbonic anhydrase-like [Alosa sapidissima]
MAFGFYLFGPSVCSRSLKKKMNLSVILLVVNVVVLVGASDDWCYTRCENTPSYWGDYYPNCNGDRQSPININTEHVKGRNDLKEFNLVNFTNKQTMKLLINNGHSVKCKLEAGVVEVSGGGLPHEYSTIQFHFHWGREDLEHFPGSEHSIDGHRYPMEMHIVSLKKGYNATQAKADPEGLSVLGFFIDVMEGDATGMPEVWKNFSDFVSEIPNKGDNASLSALNISIHDFLLDVDLTKYYRYNGSLTTPGCDEAVVWTVFQQPIRISEDLILRFAQQTGDSDLYRPQQSLHERNVYASAALGAATSDESGHEWCYKECDHGLSHWTNISGAFCNGQSQSPININSHNATYKPELGSFSFSGFSNKHTMDYLINNGHTVKAVLKEGMVRVGGGGLPNVYDTLQFHFHWGNSSAHDLASSNHSDSTESDGSDSSDQGSASSSGGSEHALDSEVYPMEMHIVSRNENLSADAAPSDTTGFAVLGFFIQETDDEDNPAIWKNFTDHLAMIQNKDSTIELHQDISLKALIGDVDLTKYYRYQGSLTTPTCNEAVIWTVFKEPIRVSKNLIKKFSKMTGLNNVFRPVQPLNGRHVYTTVTEDHSSSPPSCLFSLLLVLSSLFATLWMNQIQ